MKPCRAGFDAEGFHLASGVQKSPTNGRPPPNNVTKSDNSGGYVANTPRDGQPGRLISHIPVLLPD